MTKENKSLLQVREWKEKCRQDAENLSDEEYIKEQKKYLTLKREIELAEQVD